MKSVIPKELNYLVFADIYQRIESPKASRKAYMLLESAISCYARKGWERTTLDMIAREAGLTRPAIKHFFKDAKELRLFAVKYVRLLFQKRAIAAMTLQKSPIDMLDSYVRSCFLWCAESRTHALVWLSFLQACAHSKSDREVNTEAVNTGTDRLFLLLRQGKEAGFFEIEDPLRAARLVQLIILGGLMTVASENLSADVEELAVAHCHQIVGSRQRPNTL